MVVGHTEPFYLENIVRQGSVYGPQICIATMDKINLLGKDVVTYYGPSLPIKAVTFIDDVSGAGGGKVANNLINNCNIMEERKKMTFNNKNSKTEYMVIGSFEEEILTVTNEVKNGRIEKVPEHRMLGTWFDESGEYGINITKKKGKLQYMICTTKNEANPKNVGKFAADARIKLSEVVVIPSLLYNAEAFNYYTEKEMQQLERIQHTILTGILEIPSSTPYYALLMEIGWWTMEGRLAYKKLMLYHNIVTSDDRRVIKNIVKAQKHLNRSTTWYSSVKKEMSRYGIEIEAETVLKSKWKKHVKGKIGEKMEEEIRKECADMSKARTVRNGSYEKKAYFSTVNFQNTKKILKTRLHMSKLPGNYKGRGEGTCSLCNLEKGNTEHYFQCPRVSQLKDAWEVQQSDLQSTDDKRLIAVANFFEKVEIMIEPMNIMKKKSKKK